MDRREALKKMAVGGATAIGASAVLSSVAFADGGSKPTCRPTPATSSTLTAAITGSGKSWISITPSVSTFTPAACPGVPCKAATASVQYRWELVSSTAGGPYSLWNASSGGSIVSGFSADSTVSVTAPVVYIRNTTGTGNLTSATYVVRLTVRHICTAGTRKYWSCQAYNLSVPYSTAGGADGTLSATTQTNQAAPFNNASCDSPTP